MEAFRFHGATAVRNCTELLWDLMLPGPQLLFAGQSPVKALTAGVCALVLLTHCWHGTVPEPCLSLTKLWCRAMGRVQKSSVSKNFCWRKYWRQASSQWWVRLMHTPCSSVFSDRVTRSSFHRTMKGQSGGRTSGSSRRNVSDPQLAFGTNGVI